jgi:hypothetical protein
VRATAKAPECAALAMNAQARVAVLVKDAAHLGPAACVEPNVAEDRLVVVCHRRQAGDVKPTLALGSPQGGTIGSHDLTLNPRLCGSPQFSRQARTGFLPRPIPLPARPSSPAWEMCPGRRANRWCCATNRCGSLRLEVSISCASPLPLFARIGIG